MLLYMCVYITVFHALMMITAAYQGMLWYAEYVPKHKPAIVDSEYDDTAFST